MKLELSAAFPNSVVLVMDYEFGQPPESMSTGLVAASESCLAIGTLAEQAGETHFVLTDDLRDVGHPGMRIAFDGGIRVATGAVSLVSVLNEKLLTLPVASNDVHVKVFVNDDTEPNRIVAVVVPSKPPTVPSKPSAH